MYFSHQRTLEWVRAVAEDLRGPPGDGRRRRAVLRHPDLPEHSRRGRAGPARRDRGRRRRTCTGRTPGRSPARSAAPSWPSSAPRWSRSGTPSGARCSARPTRSWRARRSPGCATASRRSCASARPSPGAPGPGGRALHRAAGVRPRARARVGDGRAAAGGLRADLGHRRSGARPAGVRQRGLPGAARARRGRRAVPGREGDLRRQRRARACCRGSRRTSTGCSSAGSRTTRAPSGASSTRSTAGQTPSRGRLEMLLPDDRAAREPTT